jgi:hypothetical protein
MTNFVRKRLQVFISSTFTDLIEERQAAVEAILTAGHIPAGMELFTSGDESQMEVIKQWIDESDVYLLILGGRYGSVEPISGKSYTHLEYEYALERGKPYFACVVKEKAQEKRLKEHGSLVTETESPKELKEFRKLVESKVIKYWEDCKDIKIAVGETLSSFARRDDLIGWVRADQEANVPALADEIARLSRENAQLRDQITTKTGAEDTINGLSFSELKTILGQKELLDFIEQNRLILGSRGIHSTHIDHKYVVELVSLGLIEKEAGRYYKATSAGRTFLNKLEFRKLNISE